MYKFVSGSLFASLLMLTACGGGGGSNGDDGDGGITPPGGLDYVEFDSTDDVALFGASLLSIAQSDPVPETPASLKSYKSVESCETSGEVETFDTRSDSVDSPFTDSLFNIDATEFRDCVQSFESAEFSFSSPIDGYEESGTPADGTESGIDYVGLGAAEDMPLTLSTSTTQGGVTESSDLRFFGVVHTQSADEAHLSSHLYLRGEVESHGPDGDYHNRIMLGESLDGGYFVTSVLPAEAAGVSETTLDGLLGAEDLLNDDCPSGAVLISTVSPLLTEDESGELLGGELLLDADDDMATIVYNEDQSVTVTLNGGSPSTYTQEELEALEAECQP